MDSSTAICPPLSFSMVNEVSEGNVVVLGLRRNRRFDPGRQPPSRGARKGADRTARSVAKRRMQPILRFLYS